MSIEWPKSRCRQNSVFGLFFLGGIMVRNSQIETRRKVSHSGWYKV